ncbi:ribosomal L1 domain-containing protein 1-like isoform X2 [Euwallacea fornicatus]|uniref:ribosomal L1 domain-containing protein 1-like isoform X2 n=1 Tax=Euwallacea fornicatus TaxID=995702 RepID=UPI00338D67DE
MKESQLNSISDPELQIKADDVKNAVKGVIKGTSQSEKLQKQLFNEKFPLFLQINTFKVPKTRGSIKQLFRIPLKNSPLPEGADICLIVPDVKGIPNKEHERHLEHYDTLLRNKGVSGIKKIMTFHEFRTEYDTFELKNRLADLYDLFLVDGRISGKVVHKCGKVFYKKRKVPIAIRLQVTNLKTNIEQALKRAYFCMNFKSDSQSVQFGHSGMKIKKLAENVYSVVDFIRKKFPGKMSNIRSLYVYTPSGSSVPVYVSFSNPNDIKVPIVTAKRLKLSTERGELTTMYNTDVIVKSNGQVILKRHKINNEQSEEQIKEDKPSQVENISRNKCKRVNSKPSLTDKKENIIISSETEEKVEPTMKLKKEKTDLKAKKPSGIYVKKNEDNCNTNVGKKRKIKHKKSEGAPKGKLGKYEIKGTSKEKKVKAGVKTLRKSLLTKNKTIASQ